GVDGAAVDLFPNQADADKDRDHDAEDGDGGESHVDEHDALDLDRDLPEQQRRPHDQEGKDDQVVEHAIAYCFAIGVIGDGKNAGHQRATSIGWSWGRRFNFSMKKSSKVCRTGFTDSMRALDLRKASMAAYSCACGRTARVIDPATWVFAPRASSSARAASPCHRISTDP